MSLTEDEKRISDLLTEVQPMLLFLSRKTDDRGCRSIHEKIEKAYIAASYLKEDIRQKLAHSADRTNPLRAANAFSSRIDAADAGQKL